MAELGGELSLLAGHELLGLLGAHGATGQLQLVRAGVQRRISLLDGSAIAAASSDPREHLGALLVRAGHVSFEAAEQAYRTQLETSLPIGRILTMTGLVSETVVRFTIHAKIRETVLDVATWGEGRFEFTSSTEVPEATGLEVALPLGELVEAARPRIERMRELSVRFPSGRTKVVTVTGARATPGSHEALLLEATRRPQTIDDLGVVMHEAPLRILEQVAALVDAGLLRIDEPGVAKRAAPRTATPPEGLAPLHASPPPASAPAELGPPDDLFAEPAAALGADLFAEPAPDLGADLFAAPAAALGADLFAAPAADLGRELFAEPAADLGRELFAEPAADLGEELFAEPVEQAPVEAVLHAELFEEPSSSELDELAAELAGPPEPPSFEDVAVDDEPPRPEPSAQIEIPDVADELFGELTAGAPQDEGSHDLVVDDDGDAGGLDAATGAVLDEERAEADARAASDELALDTLPEDVEEEPWFPVDEAPAEDVRTPIQLVAAARQALGRGAHEEALELVQRAVAREHSEETTVALRVVEGELLTALRAELLGKGFFPLLTLERADVRSMSLSPPERFFLARMDGQRELGALVKLVPLRELDALRLAKRFRAAGHVIAAAPPPAPTAPAPAG